MLKVKNITWTRSIIVSYIFLFPFQLFHIHISFSAISEVQFSVHSAYAWRWAMTERSNLPSQHTLCSVKEEIVLRSCDAHASLLASFNFKDTTRQRLAHERCIVKNTIKYCMSAQKFSLKHPILLLAVTNYASIINFETINKLAQRQWQQCCTHNHQTLFSHHIECT